MRLLPLLPNGKHSHVCSDCGYENLYEPTEGCECALPDIFVGYGGCYRCLGMRQGTPEQAEAGERAARARALNDRAGRVRRLTWQTLTTPAQANATTFTFTGDNGWARAATHRHFCANCDAESPRCDCDYPDNSWEGCPACYGGEGIPTATCRCCKVFKVPMGRGYCWNCSLGHEKGRATRLHVRRSHCICCKEYGGRRMKNKACGWCAEHCHEGRGHIVNGTTTGKYHQDSCKHCGTTYICDAVPKCTAAETCCSRCGKPKLPKGVKVHVHSCRGVGERRCGKSFYCHVADEAAQPFCWNCRNARNPYQLRVKKSAAEPQKGAV